ncbi:c-type cytochrome, partial [Kaarinaea lacus]
MTEVLILLRAGIGVIMLMISCTATVFASRDVTQDTPRDTAPQALEDKDGKGKLIYDFYCYQCHGYAGDGKTLASTYLSPQPRNFTVSSPQELSIERMMTAVRDGRDGTAMVSF